MGHLTKDCPTKDTETRMFVGMAIDEGWTECKPVKCEDDWEICENIGHVESKCPFGLLMDPIEMKAKREAFIKKEKNKSKSMVKLLVKSRKKPKKLRLNWCVKVPDSHPRHPKTSIHKEGKNYSLEYRPLVGNIYRRLLLSRERHHLMLPFVNGKGHNRNWDPPAGEGCTCSLSC